MRLNGWQRIGMVASVIWALALTLLAEMHANTTDVLRTSARTKTLTTIGVKQC